MEPTRAPIEPEGFLDGLHWGCIVRGALLDFVLTIAASLPLTLLLAGSASREAPEALSSPQGLFWGAVVGLSATVVGAYYGARRAGRLHVRHGGWVAIVSILLGLPVYFLPAGETPTVYPLWYEIAMLTAMVPAGLLGGLLASKRRTAAA